MTTTELDTKTDIYARSDSTSFPVAEKLSYYNEADGILNGLIIQQQEDRAETVPAPVNTVAGQVAYAAPSRIHHVNWLEIDFGSGFVPARYIPEAQLISWFGTELLTVLNSWDAGYPIYFFKGSNFYVYPAATTQSAGTARLKYSVELIPDELEADDTPTLVPTNFHYLHAAYAAMSWLDEDDPLHVKAEKKWREGRLMMLETMYPRARQDELISSVPDDDGTETTFSTISFVSSGGGGSSANYADAETPAGVFDGVNDTFTLVHAPNPATSTILILNGQYLTQGVDYNLSGSTITFIDPPDALFSGRPFLAYYRY